LQFVAAAQILRVIIATKWMAKTTCEQELLGCRASRKLFSNYLYNKSQKI